ncbi:MAG TPA: LamG domain-containing protein, partial [Cellvibrio sp.]|nr:LamG domain-containing protein [Cellvibrio sp.]
MMNKNTYPACLRQQWGMLVLVISGLLAGCGSGSSSKVEPNNPPPPGNGGSGFVYKGEKPAANADVLKFQTELWINIAREDRCGGCHQTQAPAFARGDDINLAYEAVVENGLVNMADPASSRLVTKVAGGHN